MVTGRPPPIDLFLEPSRDQVEPDADIAEIQDAFDKHQREIEDLDDYFSFKNPAHSYLPYVVYPPATGRPSPIDLLNAMSCGGSGGTLGATTADVLDKLAEAAEQFPLTVQHAYQCHALGREKSLLAEWVRSIDNLFLFHFAHHIQPQGLRLTNADLVRLCYACLGDKGITNEEAVKQNRKRAKALPRDLQIRYGLIPPDECTGK